MCARFTVLSDTPMAAAIAGCAMPLSRNGTIWMRWRCASGSFYRSAVFSRRTSALLHLTICFPRIKWRSKSHSEKDENRGPSAPVTFQEVDSSRIELVSEPGPSSPENIAETGRFLRITDFGVNLPDAG